MSAKSNGKSLRYGIGAVARMTGLTDHTIRVWERRYEAVVADRAKNGRREYSEADVEKLSLLKRLTDDGIAISRIANHSVDELRERALNMRQISSGAPTPETVQIAVLGELVPLLLKEHPAEIAPIDVVVADSNKEHFVAAVSGRTIDVVALEVPVLDDAALETLKELEREANARAGVLVYRFATRKDIERATDSGIHVLRAPTDVDPVRNILIRAAREGTRRQITPSKAPAASPDFSVEGDIPPRRYSATQLAKLARISTTIECECPQHLATLVNDLCAFEIYSANCKSRDDDDRAMHHFLHVTTARVRAEIEDALERVVMAEGLEI